MEDKIKKIETRGFSFKSKREAFDGGANSGSGISKTIVYIREDGLLVIEQRFLLKNLMPDAVELRSIFGHKYQSKMMGIIGTSFYKICKGYQEAFDTRFIKADLYK